jgi:hypothetical protein
MNSRPFSPLLLFTSAALLLLACISPAAHAQRISSLPRTNTLQGAASSNLVMVTALQTGTNGSLAYTLPDFGALISSYVTGASGTNFSGLIVTNLAKVLGDAYVGGNLIGSNSITAVGDIFGGNDIIAVGIVSGNVVLANTAMASSNRITTVHFAGGQPTNSFLYVRDGTNLASGTFGSGLTFAGGTLTASGGALATNANQFGASVTLTIKDGALLTNTSIRTALTLPTLTASRAAVLNSSGQLTNSAAVSDVEIEYLDGVTSAIQTQLGTKTALATNSSQFGASTVLTIADRVSLTNINSYGTGAVFSGHVTVGSNITASSFIGSGTGTPIIKLQTMMAADNAFAISVRTNFTQLSTNFLEFTSPSAGQAMVLHSAAAGQLVWTNGAVGVRITGIQTNTTSVQCDWTTSDIVHITNSLIANVVIIPTNMVSGSSLRVVAQASTQTYTLSVSNAAGTVVLYPFASTNGGSAYTVTNGQTVELDLMSLNGKIHAAMGRFQ